jgi:polyisoprenoid-binding protein YceI
VTAQFDPASLRVQAALRSGRPASLGPDDRRSIEATIVRDVLRASRFPEIRFASTAVSARDGGHDVRGALTLAGTTRELSLAVRRRADRLETEVALRQPEFGIRPYSAMFGAIRVKPEVRVRVSVPASLPPA